MEIDGVNAVAARRRLLTAIAGLANRYGKAWRVGSTDILGSSRPRRGNRRRIVRGAAFLRGRGAADAAGHSAGGVEKFHGCHKEDPNFARGFSGLAQAYRPLGYDDQAR